MNSLSTATLAELLESFRTDVNRVNALKHFDTLGLPGNKTEPYRHFGIKPILARTYAVADVQADTVREGLRIEIHDGVVVRSPEGVTVTMEAHQYSEHHFDALYYAGHVASEQVITISLSTDSRVNIHHRISVSESLLTYRVAVKVKDNIHARVYETFENAATAAGTLVLYGYDIDVGKYGTLEWIRNQSIENERYILTGSHQITVADYAQMRLKTYDFGSGSALHLYKIDLGDHADLHSAHLVYATSRAARGNVLHINHHGQYSKSVQEAKYIVNDHATGIFDGLIRVGHDARFANARQNSKAMILSELGGARMSAKPQLEIYTDELEASHGSSTGQLDEKQIFYLRSRGISLDEAKKILILAFAHELMEQVEDKTIIGEIEAAFEAAHAEG